MNASLMFLLFRMGPPEAATVVAGRFGEVEGVDRRMFPVYGTNNIPAITLGVDNRFGAIQQ